MATRTLVLVLFVAVLGFPEGTMAQVRSSTQQTMFGSRTLGGFPTAGTRTFSGSSLSGSSFGSSSLSGSSLGSFGRTGSTLGGTGSRLGGSSLGTSMGGMQMGSSERFVRGARQPGQFVGADTQDVSGILSTLGAGAQTRSNQNFNARSLSGQGRSRVNQPNQSGGQPGGGRSGRGSRSADQLAVAVELGFEPSPPAAAEVLSTTLSSKINQSRRIQKIEPIQVSLADGTAILRGVVATPHDRELAAQWVLLEPGVRAVQNELQIAEKASSGATRQPLSNP